jgi:hypothetical protein
LPSDAALEYKKVVHTLKENSKEEMPSPYIRGGFWRNFFSKYSESNYMHKRLLWLSHVFHDNEDKFEETQAEIVRTHIYKAQCNDAYWHGVFSGLYAPHLRRCIWENILKAHAYVDKRIFLKNDEMYSFSSDIDCDGRPEHLCISPDLIVAFSESGGCVSEISYKPANLCITSTLTRRFEAYHTAIEELSKKTGNGEIKTIHHIQKVKEGGLENYLVYDDYVRNNFLLHIIDKSNTFEQFKSRNCIEQPDSLTNYYEVTERGLKKPGYAIQFCTLLPHPSLHIQKDFVVDDSNSIENTVLLTNRSNDLLTLQYALELNINLFVPDQPSHYFEFASQKRYQLNWEGEQQAGMLKIVDELNRMAIVLEPVSMDANPQKWWIFPVYTISQSEEGYEKVYQESSISLVGELIIPPMSEFLFGVSLSIFRL